MPKPTESFAQLHLHTDASFLDGVGRAAEYAEIAASVGHTHMACTDHGNLHGLPMFRDACNKFGIKPVYGMEAYVNDERGKTKEVKAAQRKEDLPKDAIDPTFTDNHLILLCENDAGWRNLLKINHESVLHGYYYKPRTSNDFVLRHSEGLIATTACMGSIFSQYAKRGELKKLREILAAYRDAMPDRFFQEIQINECGDQKKVNAELWRECRDLGIPAVLTSDIHYACQGDDARQDEMIAVSRHTSVTDPKAFKLEARNLHYMTVESAYQLQKKLGYNYSRGLVERLAARAAEVAARCDADIYPRDGKLRPPTYIGPNGPVANPAATLTALAVKGLRDKFSGRVTREYGDRLRRELGVITKLGIADFYLVTWDIVNECKRRGVMVWCRGSGCASLVAAVIGISPIDPIRFGLLFERFVDPDRPNAPDFDLDIESSRRDEIARWVMQKYGGEHGERVARIAAISTFGLKSAVRDVIFARGVDKRVGFTLSSVVEQMDASELEDRLAECRVDERATVINEAFDEFRQAAGRHVAMVDEHAETIKAAFIMVGRARNRQKHAAGFVVAPDAIEKFLPIDKVGSGSESSIVTAWGEGQSRQDIAETGLMKVDMLGLNTVEVISRAAGVIAKRKGITKAEFIERELNGWTMDFEQQAVLEEFRKGDGLGLHQLQAGGGGLARFVKRMKPTSVNDIVAGVAIYRPGAIEFMEEYLSREHGDVPDSPHPKFTENTAETRGVVVYQEQVMKLLHDIGRIPLRDAYKCIKSISKKDLGKIHSYMLAFYDGAKQQGISQQVAMELFNIVEKFAKYGFNKGHAASYGVMSWITAYLRGLYPAEFWLAWLSCTDNKSDKDKGERKIETLLRAARRDVSILPPSINLSGAEWRVTKSGKLLAPLSLVLGVGDNAARVIAEAAKSNPFTSLVGFLAWAEQNKRDVNSRAVTALAMAGAFSKFCPQTSRASDLAKAWSGFSASKKNGTKAQQLVATVRDNPKSIAITPVDEEVVMGLEREAFGFNFWMDSWAINQRTEKVERLIANDRIAADSERNLRGRRRAMEVTAIRAFRDKRGKEMAFIQARTEAGAAVKLVVFSSVWKSVKRKVSLRKVYLVRGDFGRDGSVIVGGDERAFVDLDRVQVEAV